MSVAIETIGVRRTLDTRRALDGVDLTLSAGAVTAVLGASGCGKSTLVRVLAGLEPIDAGEVRFDGETIATPTHALAPERRRVGVVFQDYALFPHLTAAGNVAFGVREGRGAEARATARDLLEEAGLADRTGAFPHELSGGEQQRVALARALAAEPRAVFLDEPFSSLDGNLRRETRDRAFALLRERGATALLVTHDAAEAMAVADHLVVMADGRVIQAGPPDAVYATPASARSARLTGDVNVWRGVAQSGRVESPLGPVPTSEGDGTPVDVLVRPHAVTVQPGGAGAVIERRPLGFAVDLTVEWSGARWRVRAPVDAAPALGDAVTLSADAAALTVTPA